MEFHRDSDTAGPLVTGFSANGFRVRDTVFPAGLLLTPEAALEWDEAPASAADLTPAQLEAVLTLTPPPEFLLLGTGATLLQPPRAFARALEARNIGVEAMDSRAAARAWGVLRAEGRWIVAALMAL